VANERARIIGDSAGFRALPVGWSINEQNRGAVLRNSVFKPAGCDGTWQAVVGDIDADSPYLKKSAS
jgi:hypothetical protein